MSGQSVGKLDGEVVVSVQPKKGSVLIFPHGQGKGRWPDPLHEGAVVTEVRIPSLFHNHIRF